jgi:hypothetical protein
MERDTTALRQHTDRWIISVDGHDLLWCANRKTAIQLVCAARKLRHRSERGGKSEYEIRRACGWTSFHRS